MKKLITICAVVGLMLSTTGVSLATVTDVNTPPDAPGWWNSEDGEYYAYGYWEDDITSGPVSPPDNATHWASNFADNNDFTAGISAASGNVVTINMDNIADANLYKKLYIYLEGTTSSTDDPIISVLDPDGGVFTGDLSWNIDNGLWHCKVLGEIHPQPEYVGLTVTVPGLTSVTNVWAGEICVPEPATMTLLSLGSLIFIRRRRT